MLSTTSTMCSALCHQPLPFPSFSLFSYNFSLPYFIFYPSTFFYLSFSPFISESPQWEAKQIQGQQLWLELLMDRKLISAYSEMTSGLLDHFRDLICSLLGLFSYILCPLFSFPFSISSKHSSMQSIQLPLVQAATGGACGLLNEFGHFLDLMLASSFETCTDRSLDGPETRIGFRLEGQAGRVNYPSSFKSYSSIWMSFLGTNFPLWPLVAHWSQAMPPPVLTGPSQRTSSKGASHRKSQLMVKIEDIYERPIMWYMVCQTMLHTLFNMKEPILQCFQGGLNW